MKIRFERYYCKIWSWRLCWDVFAIIVSFQSELFSIAVWNRHKGVELLNYKMESLIIYYVVMGIMCLMFCSFFPICKRFQNKKHIYKWLYVVPYGEAILAIFSCYFLFNNNFEKIHITIQNCYAIKHFNW